MTIYQVIESSRASRSGENLLDPACKSIRVLARVVSIIAIGDRRLRSFRMSRYRPN